MEEEKMLDIPQYVIETVQLVTVSYDFEKDLEKVNFSTKILQFTNSIDSQY